MSAPILLTGFIRYERATPEQRGTWRRWMIGDRADLPEGMLRSDERAAVSGQIPDERWFAFRERFGYTLWRPAKRKAAH